MPQGMRFRIINEKLAKVEADLPHKMVGLIAFVVIGIIIICIGIWSHVTFGPAWPIYILGAIICLFGYFIYGHRRTLVIDKLEGMITRKTRVIGLFTLVRNQWKIDRVSEFKGEKHSAWARTIDPSEVARGLGAEIGDQLTPGDQSGYESYSRTYSGHRQVVDFGVLVMKLKNGEIINALDHRYPKAPENCAKYVNLFLKGDQVTPGTFYN
ncbi:MAG: hypothetical protein HWN65_12590 [Candidatus Helarchaeota archaeon]|nr:hypothetical protein [Candidatus Helarchaeota archaeon]